MTRSTKATNRIGANLEITPLPGSPLTESNRRPSPYHLKSPRFTARQAPPAGRQPALIRISPRTAASATAPAIERAARQQPARVHAQPAAAPAPLPCRSGPARGAACRPATSTPAVKRRSDDLSHPGRSELGTPLDRHLPIARKNLNQHPYLHVTGSHRRQPRSPSEPKDTAEQAGAQSQAPSRRSAAVGSGPRYARICRGAGVAQAHTHALLGIFHRGWMTTMIAELVCDIFWQFGGHGGAGSQTGKCTPDRVLAGSQVVRSLSLPVSPPSTRAAQPGSRLLPGGTRQVRTAQKPPGHGEPPT